MYLNTQRQRATPSSSASPRTERRTSPRTRTVFFVAKVTRTSDVGLFRVRNISDAGMMLATHEAFEVGEPLLIELSENLAVEGTIEWCDDGSCGIQFKQPIDSAAFLKSLAAEKRECRRSARRLPIKRLATSYSERGVRAVTITDVSPRGVGLTHDGSISSGMFIKLVLESGLIRRGAVCWSKEGRAGVLLAEPFTQAELESAGGL